MWAWFGAGGRLSTEVTVRRPDGAPIDLGGWMAYSPGEAVRWVRKRAEHVAQQLGAPYDRAVRAWLEDAVEWQWAVQGLAAGIPFVLRAVDAEGCTYALMARPDADVRAAAPVRVP